MANGAQTQVCNKDIGQAPMFGNGDVLLPQRRAKCGELLPLQRRTACDHLPLVKGEIRGASRGVWDLILSNK
jgi:hypothetical protein